MNVPRRIHLGSGSEFQAELLNIDIDARWRPDIVIDIGSDFLSSKARFKTERFGEIALSPAGFDQIYAHHVLEHVRDLVRAMTNCLTLLRVGGVFDIEVPYDLSHGAWQDPTHVRAFNERSWIYYCEWFWYLDWRTHRFKVRSLELVSSPIGEELFRQGVAQDVVSRTPRAVETMRVSLEKIALTAEDLAELARREAR